MFDNVNEIFLPFFNFVQFYRIFTKIWGKLRYMNLYGVQVEKPPEASEFIKIYVYTALENNIIFLQQFFRFRGIFHLPLRAPLIYDSGEG